MIEGCGAVGYIHGADCSCESFAEVPTFVEEAVAGVSFRAASDIKVEEGAFDGPGVVVALLCPWVLLVGCCVFDCKASYIGVIHRAERCCKALAGVVGGAEHIVLKAEGAVEEGAIVTDGVDSSL